MPDIDPISEGDDAVLESMKEEIEEGVRDDILSLIKEINEQNGGKGARQKEIYSRLGEMGYKDYDFDVTDRMFPKMEKEKVIVKKWLPIDTSGKKFPFWFVGK